MRERCGVPCPALPCSVLASGVCTKIAKKKITEDEGNFAYLKEREKELRAKKNSERIRRSFLLKKSLEEREKRRPEETWLPEERKGGGGPDKVFFSG